MNITKAETGFIVDEQPVLYLFKGTEHEVLSNEQCHIHTNLGIIFFDTSVSIDGQTFENIQDWITELYR
jgi:hypothetical protein